MDHNSDQLGLLEVNGKKQKQQTRPELAISQEDRLEQTPKQMQSE